MSNTARSKMLDDFKAERDSLIAWIAIVSGNLQSPNRSDPSAVEVTHDAILRRLTRVFGTDARIVYTVDGETLERALDPERERSIAELKVIYLNGKDSSAEDAEDDL